MILITGAAKGLGRAIALELYNAGHQIVIHHNRSDPGELLKLCPEAQTIQGVLDEKLVQRYLERFPETTGLVNNVGNYLEDTPQTSSLELMRINVEIPMLLCQKLLPAISKMRGHIVNIGTAGILRPTVSCTSYALSKAALWNYTQSLAKVQSQVKVNMVSPGVMENSVCSSDQKPVDLEEVARLVAFLFTSDAITGQNIDIASGFRA
ncbi:MAG: putative oxidoreductase [Chlamydiales bacterium]|nr:putative oxidoreductase [Chlamydiales bacterium]MCH9635188.1 putative oxidoreductase [Chlamydiales bacterium]MCH9704268.1 SDR family NAD(P)-dependent oxidoreductase [Chlamydiota bacterium]